MRILLAPLLLAVAAVAAAAESPPEPTDDADARTRLDALIQAREAERSAGGPGSLPELSSPVLPADVELSEDNRALQQEAIGAYLRHVMASNEHQLRVFRWQLLSARIIFAVVVLLVAAGIYFAAVQFHHGLRQGSAGHEAQSTELEASMKGIRVSSPVLGVIILTISLAFFYLYLVHVYPIEFVVP